MEPLILDDGRSIFSQYMAELRDERRQADRHRFRFNLERASMLMAYEISKHLSYDAAQVNTSLGVADCHLLHHPPVLGCILRAGLPMQQGFLQIFDTADSAFISAYRMHTSENQFEINVEYVTGPGMEGRTLLLLDPMLATGRSMVLAYKALTSEQAPAEVFIAAIIASEQGLSHVQRQIPRGKLFVGSVDSELTAKSYIVPGLGDAGDIAFGEKS